MRARILPLDDLTADGESNAVALLLTVRPEEARNLLSAFATLEAVPECFRMLEGVLRVIARKQGKYEQDPVNTDGRSGLEGAKSATEKASDEHREGDPKCYCGTCFPWG